MRAVDGRPALLLAERFPAYVWLLTLALPASMLGGNAWRLGLPISPDRVLFASGLLLLALTPNAWRRLHLGWPHALIAAACLVATLSALRAETLTTHAGAFALLDRLAVPAIYFLLAPAVWSTAARRELLLQVMTIMAAYLGVTAILQFVAPALVVPSYITDPSAGIQAERARGPFLASEPMGLVMIACAAGAVLLAIHRPGPWRWLGIVATAACGVGVVLTLTRSIWVGAIVVLVAVAATHRQVRLPVTAVMLAAVTVGAVVVVNTPTLIDLVGQRATTSRSLHDRANTNAAALQIVSERPVTGIGWHTFVHEGQDYVRQADDYPITNVAIEVHNVPLGWAAENGIPAAALWGAAVSAAVIAPMLRSGSPGPPGWRAVLMAAALPWLEAALVSPVPYPTPLLLMWAVAGIVRGGR